MSGYLGRVLYLFNYNCNKNSYIQCLSMRNYMLIARPYAVIYFKYATFCCDTGNCWQYYDDVNEIAISSLPFSKTLTAEISGR